MSPDGGWYLFFPPRPVRRSMQRIHVGGCFANPSVAADAPPPHWGPGRGHVPSIGHGLTRTPYFRPPSAQPWLHPPSAYGSSSHMLTISCHGTTSVRRLTTSPGTYEKPRDPPPVRGFPPHQLGICSRCASTYISTQEVPNLGSDPEEAGRRWAAIRTGTEVFVLTTETFAAVPWNHVPGIH